MLSQVRNISVRPVKPGLNCPYRSSFGSLPNPGPQANESNSSIRALLELETETDSILSNDPNLQNLSHHLSNLKHLVDNFKKSRGGLSLRSFLNRRASTHEISKIAGEIESEIQAWIDRESIENLLRVLQESNNDDEKTHQLALFEKRVSQGFNRDLQDLVLKSKVFNQLELILCNFDFSKKLREQAALAISALIKFNKDVFVGQVLMGQTIKALISFSSCSSIKVLCSLIKSIKSPLVDEIESNGDIRKVINLLDSYDLQIRVLAFDCVLEIGYFGRKEAVEAMLKEGLIEKLVEMQRSNLGGDLIETGRAYVVEEGQQEDIIRVGGVDRETKRESRERRFLERHPFASCVARFAVQLEVGEGLRQREKRAFKQEILVRVREASVTDAEAATILAEVLWGASP
ncbi:hypothetical protein RJ641_027085 [Dillenia turbinata]|uniref:Uncharacterized protein n=1 Tax=Dillenia turbinata TaxID=194707 RepID=A0AAN8VVI1_9MAGN